MNILKSLFKRSGANRPSSVETFAPPSSSLIELEQEKKPPFDLFIDNEPPQERQEESNYETKSKISTFLERDYHSIGINDGFEYHSHENLQSAKDKIKTEYKLIIDKMIQEKIEKIFQLRIMLSNVDRISDVTQKNLELMIEEIESSISRLQQQKDLSSVDEGWVMNAIHSYHQGFVQGLNNYLASENFLKSIKNF
jgi:hypothetical protein